MDRIPLSKIMVSERIRLDNGDINDLAKSLARHGLLQPVVVDHENRLIAGGRRFLAARQLGWSDIDVQRLGELSDRERLELELEENIRRKDLSEYEKSERVASLLKTIRKSANETMAQVRVQTDLGADDHHPVETCSDSEQVCPKIPKRGPARSAGSLRDISQRTGIPAATLIEAEQHVKTVEEIPSLRDQPKMAVIEVGRELRKIADPETREAYKAALEQNPSMVRLTTDPHEVMDQYLHSDERAREHKKIDAEYARLDDIHKGIDLLSRPGKKDCKDSVDDVAEEFLSHVETPEYEIVLYQVLIAHQLLTRIKDSMVKRRNGLERVK